MPEHIHAHPCTPTSPSRTEYACITCIDSMHAHMCMHACTASPHPCTPTSRTEYAFIACIDTMRTLICMRTCTACPHACTPTARTWHTYIMRRDPGHKIIRICTYALLANTHAHIWTHLHPHAHKHHTQRLEPHPHVHAHMHACTRLHIQVLAHIRPCKLPTNRIVSEHLSDMRTRVHLYVPLCTHKHTHTHTHTYHARRLYLLTHAVPAHIHYVYPTAHSTHSSCVETRGTLVDAHVYNACMYDRTLCQSHPYAHT
jgi:hypothetical protein